MGRNLPQWTVGADLAQAVVGSAPAERAGVRA